MLNTLAKSNTLEGTALVNNFNARFKALLSEQKTAKLVSDLCEGTQLEALVKRYFDTHVSTLLDSKFDPLQTAFDTCLSGQETFKTNLKTQQTNYIASIETKLVAIDQRLSDIVVSVKKLSDSVADLKANPVHSQRTNSNMNQGRQGNALDHSAEENVFGTHMGAEGDNDSTSDSSVKSMTGRPPSFGYNGHNITRPTPLPIGHEMSCSLARRFRFCHAT